MKDIEKLLLIAADMQDLIDPHDELSKVITLYGDIETRSELREEEIEMVIAAKNEEKRAKTIEKNKKPRNY